MKKTTRILIGIIVIMAIALVILSCKLWGQEEREKSTQVTTAPTTATIQATKPVETEPPETKPAVDYVDDRFLEDMVKALTKRDEIVKQEDSYENYGKAVDAELSILKKYKNAEFEDSKLLGLAKTYISGLQTQKKANNQDSIREKNIVWNQGLEERFEALKVLVKDYGLIKNDSYLQTIYTSKELNAASRRLKGILAVDKDLQNQLIGKPTGGATSWYQIAANYTNNTEYTFDVVIYCQYYNYSGEVIETTTNSFSNITPGKTGYFGLSAPYLTTIKNVLLDWQITIQ